VKNLCRLLFAVVFGLGLTTCTGEPAPIANSEIPATKIADAFQQRLQSELMAAIKTGGAIGAIGVCQQAAPAIAAALSEEHAVLVRRVSHKPRNPGAAIDGRVVQEMSILARTPFDGSGNPSVREWTDKDGEGGTHWLRAIPMKKEPCTACHGTNIAPEVQAKLAELYPNDQATGFKPGELRGAILISSRTKR